MASTGHYSPSLCNYARTCSSSMITWHARAVLPARRPTFPLLDIPSHFAGKKRLGLFVVHTVTLDYRKYTHFAAIASTITASSSTSGRIDSRTRTVGCGLLLPVADARWVCVRHIGKPWGMIYKTSHDNLTIVLR